MSSEQIANEIAELEKEQLKALPPQHLLERRKLKWQKERSRPRHT